MKRSLNLQPKIATFVAICSALALNPTQAQNTLPERENLTSPGIDEIIVEGQKREETLLESDVSVTVIDAATIRDARLRDVRRIDDLVPNVQFNESGQLSSVFVSIRGIESNPYIVNRAAIYIDGIPFRELSNAVLNQVSSIEVLRGPQSTLYGANSEAGLILINTRKPREALEGQIRLTGSTYNGDAGFGIDGFVGSALIEDKLLGSIAFKASKEDAYVSNPSSSIGEPGEIQDLFLQGRLTYMPNDRLTVNATAYVLDTDAPGLFEQEYAPIDRAQYNLIYRDTVNGGREVGEFEFLNDVPKLTTERNIVAGVSATYELDNGALDFSLSYSDADEDSAGIDLDLTALPTAAGRDIEREEIISGEVRYTSPDSDRFEYLFGVSWYSEDNENRLGTAFGQASLSSYAFAPLQTSQSRDIALFGSATLGLGLEGLSGTLGLRLDRAKRETIQQAGILDIGFAQLPFQNISLSETFDEVLPRIVVSYEVSDLINVYASGSKGYIPGGFNLAAADAAFSDEVVGYDQETVWSYEIGAKKAFANGRGYVNFAAFYIESDNWQEVQVLFNDAGQVISTAFIAANASIESSGFEIETTYDLSDQIRATASFGYTDATYKDFQFSATENLRGRPVKLVPEFDGNIAIRYQTDRGFFARGEINVIGDTPLDERGRATRKSVATTNVQIGYEGDKYAFRLYAENLTDERMESGLAFGNFSGDDGILYAPLDAPRVIGFETELNF